MVRREEHIAPLCVFPGGPQDWHLDAGTKYPVLCGCSDSSSWNLSQSSSTHHLKNSLAFLQIDQQQGREFPLSLRGSNSDLWTRLIICVWVAKPLLAAAAAAAWGPLPSGKTSSAAGPALGWDLQVVSMWLGPAEDLQGSQDRSCDTGENGTVKNLRKEQLVDAQTGSWPRHPS